jgi:hypothetical protein
MAAAAYHYLSNLLDVLLAVPVGQLSQVTSCSLQVFCIQTMCSRGERAMDPKITQEILDDLIPSLENLETRSTAILEFLKDEGIADDEKLAPYFEKAASTSNVRWLGVRVRIERLLSSAEKESTDNRSDSDKKSAESNSPANQAKSSAETAEKKPAEVSAAEPQPTEKADFQQSQNSKDNRTTSKEDKKETSSQVRREQTTKVASPPATNDDSADQAERSDSAPENSPRQKIA